MGGVWKHMALLLKNILTSTHMAQETKSNFLALVLIGPMSTILVRVTKKSMPILNMLDRNRRIKYAPQRLQESKHKYDVIFTAEERVYDQCIEHFENTGNVSVQPCHVINIDIQDTHEEATIGAFLMCELLQSLSESQDLDDDIDELLQEYEAKCNRPILHTVAFY